MDSRPEHLRNLTPVEYLIAYLRYQKIKRHIHPGSILLDLGCGFNAELLYSISEKIKRGIGIDLAIDNKKSNEHIHLIQWNLNHPGFPELPEKVDIVTCLALAEHLDDPYQLLKNILGSLKDTGYLLLTVPSWRAKPILEFLAFKLKITHAEKIEDHKRYFNKAEIVSLCKKAGFTNVTHQYFQFGCNNFVLAKK